MVVNLCLPHFETTVQCNKLCADGYNVSNLLSADDRVRLRGFRLEYFLRPPVHVTLHFRFRVEICQVDVALWPRGMDLSQTPRGLEIHASSDPLLRGDGPHETCGQFRLVGRCEVKEGTWVSFSLPRFRPRPPFPGPPPKPPAEAKREELWSRGPQSLTSVTQLRVSLPYGGAGSPLGLKALVVWGLPARCCPPLVLDRIVKAHEDSQRQPSSALALPQPSPLIPDSAASKVAVLDSDIPEEFIDPITQELMTLPLLLPSGVVIDHSSLEKYQQQEASWGRLPNDPFTGIPFTRDSQPLPNPDLKGRIDRFLLQASATVGGAGQLGRAVQRELPCPSRLVTLGNSDGCPLTSDLEHPQSISSSSTELETFETPHQVVTPLTQRTPVCRRSEIQQDHGQEVQDRRTLLRGAKSKRGTAPSLYGSKRSVEDSSRCRNGPSSLVHPDSTGSLHPVLEEPSKPQKKQRTEEEIIVSSDPSSISHEQRLSDSLDRALKSALEAFPSFSARCVQEPGSSQTAAQGGEMGNSRCGLCYCAFMAYPGSPSAFRLPCGHLLCRHCLSIRTSPKPPGFSLSCPTCRTPAKPSSITRVHF